MLEIRGSKVAENHWLSECQASAHAVSERTFDRAGLASILASYQEEIGNTGALALEQIERLSGPNSFCVVCGQQVGLFGGPAYTVIKAISCLKLANELGAVPIFWAATEDHDVAETASTYLLKPRGDLERYVVQLPEGVAVEDLPLTKEHREVACRLAERLGISIEFLLEAKRYATLNIRSLVELFRGTGLVFLEPYLLRELGSAFFQRELREAPLFQEALCKTTHALLTEGLPAPLKIHDGLTNLFYKDSDGRRRAVAIGDSRDFPVQTLSPNVAARPALQLYTLPTAAYVAGPSEQLYWRQLEGYIAAHGLLMPAVVPRIRLTVVPPAPAGWLDRLGLSAFDLPPERFEDLEPGKALKEQLSRLEKSWKEAARRELGDDAAHLTPLMRHLLVQGSKRLRRLSLERRGVPSFALHYLRQLLRPKGKDQERLLNFWGFVGADSPSLVRELIACASLPPLEGHFCVLA